MRIFGRILLSAWFLLGLMVVLVFSFPKPASHILHSFAPYLQLIPIALLLGTVAYGILRLYRLGMKRPEASK